MKIESLDLFPSHIKIIDFDDAPALNDGLLQIAAKYPALNDSTSGVSLFQCQEHCVEEIKKRFDTGLTVYLSEVLPDRREPIEVESYCFMNYTKINSFTPVHNHLVEADIVAIYYAVTPEVREDSDSASYYAMQDGILVIHDMQRDSRLDKRSNLSRDHYKIHPRPNRMVIHPAWLSHSVTPSAGTERLAVTCIYTVNRKELFQGILRYELVL